jgi:hypothetical protein
MSLTDTIGADLQAMVAGVDRSQQEVAAVVRAVEQIAALAATSGFVGITAGLARVRDVLGQARSRLDEASGVLGEASRSVGSVAQQPSPQETIAALTPVVAALTAVEGSVAAAASAVDEARRLVVVALQGGQPGPTLGRLQQVMQILAAIRTRGPEARRHVDAALTATLRRRPYLTWAYALAGQGGRDRTEQLTASLRSRSDLVLEDKVIEEGVPGGHAPTHFTLPAAPTNDLRQWLTTCYATGSRSLLAVGARHAGMLGDALEHVDEIVVAVGRTPPTGSLAAVTADLTPAGFQLADISAHSAGVHVRCRRPKSAPPRPADAP